MEKMRGFRQDEAHALYELRRALAAAPAVLRIQGDTVAVDETVFDLDVAAFRRLLGEGTPEALEQAMTLRDCATGQSRAWPGWWPIGARRANSMPRSGPPQLVALDRLQEPVHRTLMSLYAQLGKRDAALREYQECVNDLQRDLGVELERRPGISIGRSSSRGRPAAHRRPEGPVWRQHRRGCARLR